MSDEHYPGEANEAAADEASCMEPMPPHALTREQALKPIREAVWCLYSHFSEHGR